MNVEIEGDCKELIDDLSKDEKDSNLDFTSILMDTLKILEGCKLRFCMSEKKAMKLHTS
uniref:Uncharacterized protein n=1 Tax=Nelumbo nucifera TaxID=4432 RepID=A0A822Y5W1_NELNU|nr:TPA_asm: hypothetical protein HUJ06_028187 [Nelumbo nucifera]